jgi:hypothetical protein
MRGDRKETRFWERVRRVTGARKLAFPGCWEWQGSRFENGYGRIHVRGKRIGTHRYAWECQRGAIPAGMLVLHRCDNPRCVNPDHLFLGTHADNMQDMVRKGRNAGGGGLAGEANSCARLTDDQVREIRQHYVNAKRRYGLGTQLARRYGVSPALISSVVRGRMRGEAGGPIASARLRDTMPGVEQ